MQNANVQHVNMADHFPSLPPPAHSLPQNDSGSIFNVEQLEKAERRYDCWLSELHQCPHPNPVGVRQLGLDDMGMELEGEDEEEDSLEDSEEELDHFEGNAVIVLDDDSDLMEDSSVQDNSAFNDSV